MHVRIVTTNHTSCKVSYMTLASSSDTRSHVVPYNLGGEWEGDAVPPARGWHVTKLHKQHRSTI